MRMRETVADIYYAIKPLRFLIFTESLLLMLVFFVPQGLEMLRVSMERFLYEYTAFGVRAITMTMSIGALLLFLVLLAGMSYRTLLLYRKYKEFDPAHQRLRTVRAESVTVYVMSGLPVLGMLIYLLGYGHSGLWPLMLAFACLAVALVVAAIHDDRCLRRQVTGDMVEPLLERLSRPAVFRLSLLVWLLPAIFLLSPDELAIARFIGPIGLLLLASHVIFSLVFVLHWLRIRYTVPSFLMAACWVVLCSFFNNNHLVRQLEVPLSGDRRVPLAEAVDAWVAGLVGPGGSISFREKAPPAGVPDPLSGGTDADSLSSGGVEDSLSGGELAMDPVPSGAMEAEARRHPVDSIAYGGALASVRDTSGVPVTPVYIVAAEGGGSRAAYWTAGVLALLESELPGFAERLMAISSVSGGTVGAGIWLADWHRRHRPAYGPRAAATAEASVAEMTAREEGPWRPTSAVMATVGSDLLSPLLSGFFFSDLAQQFLPFPVHYWDRSRRLEYALAASYRDAAALKGYSPLDSASIAGRPLFPMHFVNSTVVETGKKGLWAPVVPDTVHFQGSEDLAAIAGRDLRVSTTLVNSARFPIVTPGGSLTDSAGRVRAHLVDGGYYENTGIETAYSLLRSLDPLRRRYHIRPVLIYIQNSRGAMDYPPAASTLTASNPLRVFYQSWSSRSPSNLALVRGLQSALDFDIVHIRLEHRFEGAEYAFPLAWVLSGRSKQAMDVQLERLRQEYAEKNQ